MAICHKQMVFLYDELMHPQVPNDMKKILYWIRNARAYALPQSALPAVVAVFMAVGSDHFSIWLSIVAVVGVMLAHLSVNLFDDYFDFQFKSEEVRERMAAKGERVRRCGSLGGQHPVHTLHDGNLSGQKSGQENFGGGAEETSLPAGCLRPLQLHTVRYLADCPLVQSLASCIWRNFPCTAKIRRSFLSVMAVLLPS